MLAVGRAEGRADGRAGAVAGAVAACDPRGVGPVGADPSPQAVSSPLAPRRTARRASAADGIRRPAGRGWDMQGV